MKKEDFLKPFKMIAMVAVVLGLVFTTSCDSDDDDDDVVEVIVEPATQNIVELVVANSTGGLTGLDSLGKYLSVYPDLIALFSGPGDFTVFAPDNNAFIGLLATPGFPSKITSINPDIIKEVLAYHASATRYEADDLTAGTEVTTLSSMNEKIVVNDNGTLFTGSSNAEISVKTANIRATNGVVHIVESVMIPPTIGASLTPILGTNAGTLLLGADFSVLAQGIRKADTYAEATTGVIPLVDILSGETEHTVFAPTNATFNAAAGVTAEDDAATASAKLAGFLDAFTAQQWYGIIANHVVLETVAPADISNGLSKNTPVGSLTFYIIDGAGNFSNIFIDSNGDFDGTDPSALEAEIALPDAAVVTNGRVHVIAGILLP
ncbi:MAG: fasciclin domain-containing protein [Cyclobacteriaceae bacterium]